MMAYPAMYQAIKLTVASPMFLSKMGWLDEDALMAPTCTSYEGGGGCNGGETRVSGDIF